MKLTGKVLIAHRESKDGSDVVMLCGSFSPNMDVKTLLGDKFNIGLLSIEVQEGCVVEAEKHLSPEDFLENMDDFDWKEVLAKGKKIG